MDGSVGVPTAVEFALEEAARRGAAVRVLSALPEADYWATAYGMSQSRDADLLVLGHRGRGALRSALLGSVGLQCVMHASVPVTVVRTAPHRAVPDEDRDTAW